MQEIFNIGVLLIWPLVCCIFYARLSILVATFISVFAGFLFLPVGVYLDLPLLPNFDKYFSSFVGVLLGLILIKKQTFKWLGGNYVVKTLIFSILVITIINYFFNTHPIFNGEYWIAGITFHEAIAACMRNYLAISFLVVALNVIKTENDVIQLHKLLIIALLVYLPFIIVEIVISPQLHRLVYGFHPHSFAQQVRDGGFRPMVFIGHGLLVANVYLGGFIALLILHKLKRYFISESINSSLIAIFFILLIFLKSATALVLAIIALTILFLFSFNLRSYALKSIVFVSLIYPFLVSFDLIPLDTIHILLAEIFPQERLQSLFFRLYSESQLIKYLDDYLMIGYGGMGRALLAGSIVDGTWLVYITMYGLIFWFIHVYLYSFYLYKEDRNNKCIQKVIHIFSVLPIVILLDQIPNSSWSQPWVWLYVGAIIRLNFSIYKNTNRSYIS